ncbi:helix-turn-helix domain-containing protein [Virgibacillus salexigens]|uniref:HTH-type transcriptional regulator PuuR n=1 Tax=Virgibacillus massiliensis TaxID=1462526 RepID=A0A024QC55_9BACI|nr:helix-turn-helix transcriptional regulator [Virgibacillus massiliensis]CDQ39496.1 HTH-type transcriptional regulator PuuR [Virgibacillus massiliensis]
MELDKEIGEKLKKIRKEKTGMSTREAGRRIGVSNSYVSRIENGRIPSLSTLQKLCDLYGISLQSLFGKEVETPKELEGKVKWIAFGEEMEEDELTPEDIKSILKFLDKRSKKD